MTAGLADQRHRPATGKINRTALTRAVERVFRGLNTDLLIRPIRHRLAGRVRAHVLIRLLAYYVTWHMQQKLAPMLFKDDDPATARAARPSPPPGPAPLPPPAADPRRWPKTPPSTHRRRARAQPRHLAGRPGHHRRQPYPARPGPARIHPDHHAHAHPTPRLGAPRHHPPLRAPVVRQHQNTARFRRPASCSVPTRGKFGLAHRDRPRRQLV